MKSVRNRKRTEERTVIGDSRTAGDNAQRKMDRHRAKAGVGQWFYMEVRRIAEEHTGHRDRASRRAERHNRIRVSNRRTSSSSTKTAPR